MGNTADSNSSCRNTEPGRKIENETTKIADKAAMIRYSSWFRSCHFPVPTFPALRELEPARALISAQ